MAMRQKEILLNIQMGFVLQLSMKKEIFLWQNSLESLLIECFQNYQQEKAALRELKEETGYFANKITYLGQIAPSPGFCDEVVHIYKAHELKKGETNFDHDEFLNLNEYSLEEVKNMIIEGKITDAKTIACLFFYENIK